LSGGGDPGLAPPGAAADRIGWGKAVDRWEAVEAFVGPAFLD